MKRDVYLSVDLDYWFSKKVTGNGLDFIQKVFNLDRPITVYTEHHLILKEITKQYRKVYNVDFHSDISDKAWRWPNCGTWANYVYGREDAKYEWRYPSQKVCVYQGHGLCHNDHEEYSEYNPFTHKELWTWKNVSRTHGIDNLELDKVDRISIILSPKWSDARVIKDTLLFIKKYGQKGNSKFHSDSVDTKINSMLKGYIYDFDLDYYYQKDAMPNIKETYHK